MRGRKRKAPAPPLSKRQPKSRRRNPRPKKSTRTKKTPTRAKTSMQMSTSVAKDFHVYMNPFSNASHGGRIPDGKVSESIATRNQVIWPFEARLFDTNNPTIDILMYGGLGGGAVIGNLANDGDGRAFKVLGYTDHGQLDASLLLSSGGTVNMANDTAKFRVVSQGLKITLTNNAETNDGWWEAIRLTPEIYPEDYQFAAPGNLIGMTTTTLAPVLLNSKMRQRNLVNSRTYKTGLLKDIHKHTFLLHPEGADHDFIQPPAELDFDSSEVGPDIGTPAVARSIVRATGTTTRAVNGYIDHSWDYTYIRIHPNWSDANTRSKFFAHLVGNQEVVYPDSVRDSKYHSSSNVATPDQLHAAKNAMRTDAVTSMTE